MLVIGLAVLWKREWISSFHLDIVAPALASKLPSSNAEKSRLSRFQTRDLWSFYVESKTPVTPTPQQQAQNAKKGETKPSSARTNDSNKKSSKTDDQKPTKKEETIEKSKYTSVIKPEKICCLFKNLSKRLLSLNVRMKLARVG
jgi:hypothetical protein